MAGETGGRPLSETPTWAVALVFMVMIVISMLMEHGIHSLGNWFQKRQKKAMKEALEKIKAELMLLGFISLLLSVGQATISKMCIPSEIANKMLPCEKKDYDNEKESDHDRRKLLWSGEEGHWRRVLAGPTTDYCSKYEDRVPLISPSGLHELHIFIFVLAVFHVLYSVLTMTLGQAKMRKWKAWESDITSLEPQFSNDPSRFRFAHQTSFVKRHMGLSSTPGIKWIVAILRQFFASVLKVDYLTMRHGFINAHLSQNSKFNFHKYIKRSLEDDFKVVVGISFPLWFMAIMVLLLDVYGWYTLFWMSFVPAIVLIIVGTKLELVIMEMAQHIQERTAVVKGVPLIEPSNKFFWFNRPRWILFLIHLTLFENAFQMAHFLWTLYSFGVKSCFHDSMTLTIIKLITGVALQILCSYITFPLYALVTQMGSHMKRGIFEEQTSKALKKWRLAAKERKKMREAGLDLPSGFISSENTPSRGSSPMHLLHKYKSTSVDVESLASSPRYYQSENEISEIESPTSDKHGDPKSWRPSGKARDVEVLSSVLSFSST